VINDLVALQVEHYTIDDSSYLYRCVRREDYVSLSLKDVARTVLDGMEIPSIHDSVNDARLVQSCGWGDAPRVLQTSRNKAPERRKKTTKSDNFQHFCVSGQRGGYRHRREFRENDPRIPFLRAGHATLAFDNLPGRVFQQEGVTKERELRPDSVENQPRAGGRTKGGERGCVVVVVQGGSDGGCRGEPGAEDGRRETRSRTIEETNTNLKDDYPPHRYAVPHLLIHLSLPIPNPDL